MIVLGIESSCDETAAAVVDGSGLRSNVVHTQVEDHAPFGGVVPEVASRQHLRWLAPVVEEALAQAGLTLPQVDALAVTAGPGLVGCLLVGVAWAKAAAYALGKPLVAVNHLEGHLTAPFLTEERPHFPLVALLVSGGHTSLVYARDFGDYTVLGSTRDDAAGEAFDKVGKLLGLGYPAGPVIDRLAREGDAHAVELPRGMMYQGGLDFSFSGMKTAVLQVVKKVGVPRDQALADLCASFQEAVVDVLVEKTFKAARLKRVKQVVVSGGVAANSRLRAGMAQRALKEGIQVYVPPPALCADNAAMIAWAGRQRLLAGQVSSLDLTVTPGWALAGGGE